ncbi:hypothetical protein VHEMI02972 [[Torrubiella] hemipterigena]|uniref:DUF676 domain-containing protein n=1 Tax=[Torrubiella] hemipterigena TaxID=1531966 RepID=A0A0A1TC19_9HYPO|nr:hypothetical protein VHEMI02972 [[Torrubiella] hemipterigena]
MANLTKSKVPFTWRVGGIPIFWSKEDIMNGLSMAFECYTANIEIVSSEPVMGHEYELQVATMRFTTLPASLENTCDKAFHVLTVNPADGATDKVLLTIDRHFEGLTTLYAPPGGQIDVNIIALSGLGSHPYGSFVHKESGVGHMWLQKDIPARIPNARVLIYGYDTKLENSDSFATLKDLARPIATVLKECLSAPDHRPYVILAHSLGGLLVQEAILQISESEEDNECNLLRDLLGILFFGVPTDGMLTEPLLPLVEGKPNQPLIEALSMKNQPNQPGRNFANILEDFKVWCFYETKLSPTVIRDETTGKLIYGGEKKLVVSERSATACLRRQASDKYSVPLEKTHSDLVKLSPNDTQKSRIMVAITEACKPVQWLPHIETGERLLDRDPGEAQKYFQYVLDDCNNSVLKRGSDSLGLVLAYRGLISVNKIYARRGRNWFMYLSNAEEYRRRALSEVRTGTLAHESLKLDNFAIQEIELRLLSNAGRPSTRSLSSLAFDIRELERDVKAQYTILPRQHRFLKHIDRLLIDL